MERTRIDRFIQKYNLSGNAEQVKWSFKDDTLSTTFVTDDKSLLGNVKMTNIPFEDIELGVYDTAQLQKLLGVLGNDVSMAIDRFDDKAVSLKVKNGVVSINYTLSDLTIIPQAPEMKKIPNFDTKITLDSNFITTFVRGKQALPESTTFTIVNNSGQLNVIIGYANTNTNRVIIPVVTTMNSLVDDISFNAELFKEVLVANKECTSAVLELSSEGLARVNFKVDDYDSTYYLVATQGVE